MKSLYQYIEDLETNKWHYYYGIDNNTPRPFIDNTDYIGFIFNHFQQGGKMRIFEWSNISPNDIKRPNHICSVFFLGIILYNQTKFSKKYKLKESPVGYATFPFIWFLIALFHDNAYCMEDEKQLQNVSTIPELIAEFNIEHSLFDRKFSKCRELLDSRENYFLFRKQKCKVVDHGILGGMLLFDRLVKIRREQKKADENTLFWGRRLENQYKTAANAISIHNIWLPQEGFEDIYRQFNLEKLIGFKPVKFKDFPLFYILGIVDTIEPLKAFESRSSLTDVGILKSIDLEFGENFLLMKKNDKLDVDLDFEILAKRAKSLKNWLDIDFKENVCHSEIKLIFK